MQDSAVVLPGEVELGVGRYLRLVDRLVPGRVVGFYVVGSTALGAFRAGRSDIDFVAVVDRGLSAAELRRLRLVHVLAAGRSALLALGRGQVSLPGNCNGVFVRAADLATPVTTLAPVVSHSGPRFAVGRSFEVNPVMWKVFAERGIAVRGAAVDTLGLQPEPEQLRPWNLDNLDTYWRSWADRASRRRWRGLLRHPRLSAPLVLGVARLHRTVATGEVVSKEAAGQHALATFDPAWHPLVEEALAHWRGAPRTRAYPTATARTRQTARFVDHVIASAHRL